MASRALLSEEIEREIMNPGATASTVLVIDLDGFKAVNDTFGHAAGDELLIATANRIKRMCRPGDVCARLGGDEFAVFLPGADLSVTVQLATGLIDALAEPTTLARGQSAVTASVGIARIEDATNANDVLRDADVAMYEAKAAGRNRLAVFEHEMGGRRAARLQLESELRHALELEEFELYYQPIVHHRTGALIATEALLRWNHPRRGVLTPDQFLSAAEDIGILIPLGEWVVAQACHQAVQWQRDDPIDTVTMAVNVSAHELLDSDFVPSVRKALETSGLPGGLLLIEITERVMASDRARVRQQIDELKRLGIRIAIGGFGTGPSSLADLRELSVDVLIIDGSFIEPLAPDGQATALLKAILAIADALRLTVIIEAVETATQLEVVGALGCEVVQGFLVARPMPASDVTELLELDARRQVITN
jgi:diguanylate cyclase (GGDEF)-like protein